MSEKRLQGLFLFVSILAIYIGYSSQQVILTGLSNKELDLGSRVYFAVAVSYSVDEDGVWRKNGTELATIPNKTAIFNSPGYRELVINSFQTSDVGQYTFTILGESTSALLSITGVVWSNWSPWSTSSCPVSCGEGVITRSRTRTCQGGSTCPGNAEDSDTQTCSLQDCGVFAEKLEDTVAGPGSVHVFIVRTVEADIQGTWYKNNNTRLSATDRIDIETEGNNHSLTIRDVKLSDSGQYTFAVNGDATSACLTVSDEIWGVWSAWSTSSCSVTCGEGMITHSRNRTCQGGSSCPGNATESDMKKCSLENCGITAPVKSTNDEFNWLIAAIGAVIVIGIALLILIIVCCIFQCREKKPKVPTSVGTASLDLDERHEYLTRAKYNDPKLNGSEYTSTLIQ